MCEDESEVDLYKFTMKKALLDVNKLSKHISESRNYCRLYEYSQNCLNIFNETGTIPDNYQEKIFLIISDMIDNLIPTIGVSIEDRIPCELFNHEYISKMPETLNEILHEIKSNPSEDKKFMMYVYTVDPLKIFSSRKRTLFDFKLFLRVMKPDLFRSPVFTSLLKDEFGLFYEDMYRKSFTAIKNKLSRCPGISSEDAYSYTERLLSVEQYFLTDNGIKSDVKMIRNSLLHYKYEVNDTEITLHMEDHINIKVFPIHIIKLLQYGKFVCYMAEFGISLIIPEIIKTLNSEYMKGKVESENKFEI